MKAGDIHEVKSSKCGELVDDGMVTWVGGDYGQFSGLVILLTLEKE